MVTCPHLTVHSLRQDCPHGSSTGLGHFHKCTFFFSLVSLWSRHVCALNHTEYLCPGLAVENATLNWTPRCPIFWQILIFGNNICGNSLKSMHIINSSGYPQIYPWSPGHVAQLDGTLSHAPKGHKFNSPWGTYLGCGFDPHSEHVQEACNRCFSLPSSLPKINKPILGWG